MGPKHLSCIMNQTIIKSPVVVLSIFTVLLVLESLLPCCFVAAQYTSEEMKTVHKLQNKMKYLEDESHLFKKKQEYLEKETRGMKKENGDTLIKFQELQLNFNKLQLQFVNVNEKLVNQTTENQELQLKVSEMNSKSLNMTKILVTRTEENYQKIRELERSLNTYKEQFVQNEQDVELILGNKTDKLEENYQQMNKKLLNYSKFILLISSDKKSWDAMTLTQYLKNSLKKCLMEGYSDLVSFILDLGADVNFLYTYYPKETPLGLASLNGHVSMITELIKHGANLERRNEIGRTSLHLSSQEGHVSVVTELIKYGADIECKDENGDTPLHLASYNGKLSVVTELITHGANVSSKDYIGQTPLHRASIFLCPWSSSEYIERNDTIAPYRSIVAELIKHGANVDSREKNERTPLHMVSLEGCEPKMIEYLIKHGANIESKDINGQTPLHLTTQTTSVFWNKFMTRLIKHGADIDSQDNSGQTPLHLASSRKFGQAVAVLISHGANTGIKDNDGETALNDH